MKDIFPKNILITGATGSIGSALAQEYAAPGKQLILQGRNAPRLAEVADACRALGAQVETRIVDITDLAHLTHWLDEVDSRNPVDLIICNAGMNTNIGPTGAGERWEDVSNLLDTNVRASMAIAHAVLPGMRARGRGQIVFISSLAAWFGLPVTPTYCASKAAIKAYGEALRGWLAPEGIRVNVVMPGYVDSPMCRDMPGPKPFLWQPAKAAKLIRRGLAANKPRISFPFPLNLGCWLLAVIHPRISEQILRWLNYGH